LITFGFHFLRDKGSELSSGQWLYNKMA
jgi:hypothetical protein